MTKSATAVQRRIPRMRYSVKKPKALKVKAVFKFEISRPLYPVTQRQFR